MDMTRRFFIGGASAFGAFGAFGGNRLVIPGTGMKNRGRANITFGVVSDVHITKVGAGEKMEAWGNNLTFRHTLEWFRAQGVDAIVIAGDIADNGTLEQMEAVAQAWYSVFPGDRYPDGRPIEKVFVIGNHDYHGYLYGNFAAKLYPDKAELAKHVLRSDMAGFWKRIFNEDYTRFYRKTVKGYDFLGQHWDDGTGMETGYGSCDFGVELQAFLDANGKSLNPALPFFYVQHPHPKNTCYGSWAWGRDSGKVTKALSAYPNAVAFSGHSHYSLTDERSIWQGTFTSVGTSSLRYTGIPYDSCRPAGYENSSAGGRDSRKYDAAKLMRKFSPGDCRQGMLWRVYDDCMVVQRREFLSDTDAGPDWVIPLPAAESKPFTFAARARKSGTPEFANGAVLKLSAVKAKTRGGMSRDKKTKIPSEVKDALRIDIPAAISGVARTHEFEIVAEAKTPGGAKKTKLVIAEGFNHGLRHKKASSPSHCIFARDELPAGEVRFTVTPVSCFGNRGRPLTIDAV